MPIFGPNELMEDVHASGLCVDCGACVNLCPYFKTYRGRITMLFPCSSTEGRCHAFCPKTEVDLDALSQFHNGTHYSGRPPGEYREIHMARAGHAATGDNFQDGGTASALMMFALDSGIIDSAVLTGRKGSIPEPGIATRAKEVASFASSKYMAAPTIASLNDGIGKGFRRMGVVGTPCQLTAVAQMRTNQMRTNQMRTNPNHIEKFADPVAITVGLFCTWALETRALAAFLEERTGTAEIRRMTIPPPPANVLVVETEKERVEISLDEIRTMVPEGCGICPDMTAEWSDVSVGAMEGKEKWNTLIVRSTAGEQLVSEAVSAGYLETETFPEESREHLMTAAGNKKKRALAKAEADGILNTGKDRRSALRLRREVIDKILSDLN